MGRRVLLGRRAPHMSAAFANACDTGDVVAVRRFVAEGADPNYVDQGCPVLCSGLTEVYLQRDDGADLPSDARPERRIRELA
eukprot:COSAG01_NODE_36295_length_519_cov_2.840476_1_plen_81_part_01